MGAIRRILDGEREYDALAGDLDHEDALIIRKVLEGLGGSTTDKEIHDGRSTGR